MSNETKEKKTRTPRTVDSITAGALALPLEEKVKLCKELKDAIYTEVKSLAGKANGAQKISEGL